MGTNNGVFVIDEAIPWEIKQIFDKTVQLRQIDICDQFGLMIFCDFKGRICVFRLSEFAQIISDSSCDQSQAKTKAHCKERKLEFLSGCHVYAISKQLVNKADNFKIVAACGRKLILIQYKSPSATSNMCNNCAANHSISSSPSSQNLGNIDPSSADLLKLFLFRKEIICSDVPNLINLVASFTGENYILAGYKNKCELIAEKSGECLKQFQFNQLSNIRSIVELYDNHQLEILVTYNCKYNLKNLKI